MTRFSLILSVALAALALAGCGLTGPAPAKCGPATCSSGCCDAQGVCQGGLSPLSCGSSGMACMACSQGMACQLGFCITQSSSGGGAGGGNGGGSGGGSGGGVGGGAGGGVGGGAGGGAGGGGGAACTPKTCAELAPVCGTVSDGCTGTLACGSCNTSGLVVSQVYGGGGNAGSTYTNDFIELYNGTSAGILLEGWSVQYASATSANWQVTALSGSLAPGKRLLVAQAAGSGGTVTLPSPDVTGIIAMAAGSGKVALVRGTAPLPVGCPTANDVVDLVGYGAADCNEGSATAPAPSATLALMRNGSGCADSNDNAADFSLASPTPRSSASSALTCSGAP